MRSFRIEQWLSDHSMKVEKVRSEIVFTHWPGKTSILLALEPRRECLISAAEPQAAFYANYSGASIGSSHLIIATNIAGGMDISHGFRIPDLHRMTEIAKEQGIEIPSSEQVFMAGAAYMFFYTIRSTRAGLVLREYDRDFKTSRTLAGLEDVFESWWQIVNS